MKRVYKIRAARTFAGPGSWAGDAEAMVVLDDESKVFVHVNDYDGMQHYTVSKESIFDEMTGTGGSDGNGDTDEPEEEWHDYLKEIEEGKYDATDCADEPSRFIEEYSKLSAAKESEYYKVFQFLKKSVDMVLGGIE